MNRNNSESGEHEKLIKDMITTYQGKGYTNIQADLQGFSQPSTINGFIPDIVAKKPGGIWIVLEAETCGSINDSHTAQQWTAFYNYTTKNSYEFHVIVPKSCKNDASTKLNQLGLSAIIWS